MNRQYGALSGVAIVLIVLNHAVTFGLGVSPVEGAWLKVLVLLQALGAFAVPVFLFVSGAFLAYAAPQFSIAFVRSSLERILWPYLIWSAIFFALIYTPPDATYPFPGYVKDLLVGHPYHFVPLLVFWYLATPAVVLIGRRHGLTLMAGIAAWQVWLLAIRFPRMFGVEALPGWVAATVPPVLFTTMADWGLYFPLGLVMSLHGRTLKPRLERWRPAAAATTAILFGLGLLNAYGMVDAPWARFAAPVPMMFLLPTIDRASIPFLELFERLGRRSYGIYLSHFVVMNGLVLIVGKTRLPLDRVPLLVFPLFFLTALGVSLSLMEALSKVTAGRRVYRYVFGIVPPPPPQARAG